MSALNTLLINAIEQCINRVFEEESGCSDYHVARYLLATPLSGSNLALPDNPARIVYRACLTEVAWDRFEPFGRKHDQDVKHRLFACDRNTSKWWDVEELDDHIQMGFNSDTDSPFISFSCDLEWSVYHTLKQEFVGGQVRKLYQVQVPEDHIFDYDGDDHTSHAFVESASEVFAHRFVDVYAYEELRVSEAARQVSQAWFGARKQLPFPTYPFAEWRELTRGLLDNEE